MLSLQVLTQPGLDPSTSHAWDVALLERAPAEPPRAVLRVWDVDGEVLSLGRYHVAPAAAETARLHRRLTGGRLMPLGAGFVVVSLTLPHRAALVAGDPLALRADQVLNRCVRGVLRGLRGLGIDAFYPGRDRITVDRRMVGTVSLEVDARGAALFEVVLAVAGDWLSVPRLVAAVDGEGGLVAEQMSPAEVTALSDHKLHPSVAELADCVSAAYAKEFGLALTSDPPADLPADGSSRLGDWIGSRRRLPALRHHAVTPTQLGVVEAYLELDGRTIAEALIAGDFIADSPSLLRLEQRLRGCPLDRAALAGVVDEVYRNPNSFVLGIGPLQRLVETIARAGESMPHG